MMDNKLTRVIKAISLCHAEKDKLLDVKFAGAYAIWDADKDDGWIEYRNARNEILSLSVLLNKALSKLHII